MTATELCARIKRTQPYLPVDRIVCADGFAMSVQAGEGIYSEPRNDAGPWTTVEVGFPTEREDSLMEWCETPESPTATVYGYVPIEVVLSVIERHGGVAS